MNKIKTKKTVIAQHYQRADLNWQPIYLLIFVCMIGFVLSFMLSLIFSIIIGLSMIFCIYRWLKKVKYIQQQQKILNEWQLPQIHLEYLKVTYPQISEAQCQWIIEGFKDYLAMHLWGKRHFAMPSKAVDELWHRLLTDPITYRAMCLKILDRELKHVKYEQTIDIPNKAQREAYFEAWRISCSVNSLDPRHTLVLPRLFAIDYVIGLKENPEQYLKNCLVEFKHYLQQGDSVHSLDSSCSSCSSCGGD